MQNAATYALALPRASELRTATFRRLCNTPAAAIANSLQMPKDVTYVVGGVICMAVSIGREKRQLTLA
jgi:hypothetical protein